MITVIENTTIILLPSFNENYYDTPAFYYQVHTDRLRCRAKPRVCRTCPFSHSNSPGRSCGEAVYTKIKQQFPEMFI